MKAEVTYQYQPKVLINCSLAAPPLIKFTVCDSWLRFSDRENVWLKAKHTLIRVDKIKTRSACNVIKPICPDHVSAYSGGQMVAVLALLVKTSISAPTYIHAWPDLPVGFLSSFQQEYNMNKFNCSGSLGFDGLSFDQQAQVGISAGREIHLRF